MNAAVTEEREKLTKKALTADHPTWCRAAGISLSGRFLQGSREAPISAGEHCYPCGHWMFLALSLFR